MLNLQSLYNTKQGPIVNDDICYLEKFVKLLNIYMRLLPQKHQDPCFKSPRMVSLKLS